MAGPLTPLEQLGEHASRALADDGGAREAAIEVARQRFTAAAPAKSPAPLRFVWPAAALAAAALAGFFVLKSRPLSFRVDGVTASARDLVTAPQSKDVVMRFSDGSSFDLSESTRARVVEASKDGADIALEQGSLDAKVVHSGHAAWRVIAGPFVVKVTGTGFKASWDPAAQAFALSVNEGSVVVSASALGADRIVRAGEQVSASNGASGLAWQAQIDARTAALPPSPGPSALPEPAPDSGSTSASKANGEASDATWRALAKAGDLRGAFAAAEARGFAGACEAASPAELLVLGDAARLSGRPDRATAALLALRRRYPHDARRAAAAFALGKVAFDQRHDYAQAADWFAKCWQEQPQGSLAREAAGRRLEALRKAGSAAQASQAARDYLELYPTGPHAELARAQLK
jgi:TolA-binding protein